MGADQEDRDYQQTFTVPRRPHDSRSAEQWLRDIFENAPAPLRLLLVVGWRYGLGLRLGPLRSPAHVLGWRITERELDLVRLSLGSRVLTAGITLNLGPGRTDLDSRVSPHNWAGQLLWAAALPLHRLIVPRVLRRASRLD